MVSSCRPDGMKAVCANASQIAHARARCAHGYPDHCRARAQSRAAAHTRACNSIRTRMRQLGPDLHRERNRLLVAAVPGPDARGNSTCVRRAGGMRGRGSADRALTSQRVEDVSHERHRAG
eukprot:5424574-Prymnesium_polylepis.3